MLLPFVVRNLLIGCTLIIVALTIIDLNIDIVVCSAILTNIPTLAPNDSTIAYFLTNDDKYNKTTTTNEQLQGNLDLFSLLNDERKDTKANNLSNKHDLASSFSIESNRNIIASGFNILNNNTKNTNTLESFQTSNRFNLKISENLSNSRNSSNNTIVANNNETAQTVYYSLPKWFYYELYKSKYNKTSAESNSNEDKMKMDAKRRRIYLQTALKVLDYRARYRANKTSSLVFINELSDLVSEWVININSGSQFAQ